MPNRVIRESLLDSQRYWSCTIEARELFVHLLLLADDLGCVSLAPVFLRRRCFDSPPASTKIDAFIGQMIDADLLRVYQSDGGRYGFVPRYRQRLQRIYPRYPIPPEMLYSDDEHAKELFSKIISDRKNLTVGQRLDNGYPSTESESNLNRNESKQTKQGARLGAKAPFLLPTEIPKDLWDEFLEMRRRIRKPATDRAQWLIIGRLQNLAPDDHAQKRRILQQSIRNGWQDVFPIRAEAQR